MVYLAASFAGEDEIDLISVVRLGYMLAVIDEVLKLYPPVSMQSNRVVRRGGDMIAGGWVPGGEFGSNPFPPFSTFSTLPHSLLFSLASFQFYSPPNFFPAFPTCLDPDHITSNCFTSHNSARQDMSDNWRTDTNVPHLGGAPARRRLPIKQQLPPSR